MDLNTLNYTAAPTFTVTGPSPKQKRCAAARGAKTAPPDKLENNTKGPPNLD
jgi:hypothetical protein